MKTRRKNSEENPIKLMSFAIVCVNSIVDFATVCLNDDNDMCFMRLMHDFLLILLLQRTHMHTENTRTHTHTARGSHAARCNKKCSILFWVAAAGGQNNA